MGAGEMRNPCWGLFAITVSGNSMWLHLFVYEVVCACLCADCSGLSTITPHNNAASAVFLWAMV